MPPVSEFTKFVGSMCARKMKSVYELGPKIGIEPDELLDMINGKKIPTQTGIRGLAKELNVDERYLDKLAEEIRNAGG